MTLRHLYCKSLHRFAPRMAVASELSYLFVLGSMIVRDALAAEVSNR